MKNTTSENRKYGLGSRKHRPRKHRPALEITNNKTYTFDENSLSVALVFPIVFGYLDADFAFFVTATMKTTKSQFVSTVFLNERFAHYTSVNKSVTRN